MKYLACWMVAVLTCLGSLRAQTVVPLKVECTVLSHDGAPVDAARVLIMVRPNFNQEAEKDQMLATGFTDAKGVLLTPLSGWVKETMLYGTVIASKKGVGVAGTTIVYARPRSDAEPIKVTLKLLPTAECRVRLLKPDGSPATGVKVRVDQCTMPMAPRGFMYTERYLVPDLPETEWHGITDAAGRCVIPNLPRKAYLYLRHDAEGLAQLPGRYVMHFKEAPRALDEESAHQLVIAGNLRGRIILPDGSPVKGASVYLLEDSPYVTAYGEQLRVDEEGRFEFRQVPPSSYKIEFRGPKHDEARWIGSKITHQLVDAGKTTDVGDLKLAHTAVVTGRVLDDETGKEIEEPVVFYLQEGSHQLRYHSQHFEPAKYLPPSPSEAISVHVSPGEHKSIEFRLKPLKAEHVIQGIVLDEQGKPVAEAAVQLMGDHGLGYAPPSICDAKGKFRFIVPGAKDGIAIIAWTENGISEPLAVKAGGVLTVPMQTTGLAAIRGVIRDEQGQPVQGALFQILCDTVHGIHGGPIKEARQVEADGRFSVPVVPRSVKEVTLFASAEGYGTAALRDHKLKPGETLEWNPVLQTLGEFIEGIVVDKQGAFVAGAQVRISGDSQPTNHKPSMTDAAGRFRIDKLAAGPVRVSAVQKTAEFTRDAWINAKAPQTDLRLVLPDATGKASGTVLDHDGRPLAGVEVESYARGRKTTTDNSGHFNLAGLELGWFSVNVRMHLPNGTLLDHLFRLKTGMANVTLTMPETSERSAGSAAPPVDLTGKPAPEIHVATWIHTEPLAAKAGGKVRILDFWGMECAPCLAGFPKVQKFWQDHQQDGIEFIALSSAFYPEQEVREYLKSHPDFRFPIALGLEREKDANAYQVRGIPTYVVIGKDGLVLSSGHDWDEAASMALKAAKQ